MPELPEVETIVRGLRPLVEGRKIIEIEVLKPEIVQPDVETLRHMLIPDGFIRLGRHGKYILWKARNGCGYVHLRMTGQLFHCENTCRTDSHTHLIISFENGEQLRYRDVRRFGRWVAKIGCDSPDTLLSVGPDALEIQSDEFGSLLRAHSRRGIKSLLLDQRLLAGIGNIYADEICFAAGIRPEVPCGMIDASKIYLAMRKILNNAIKHHGTSISDYVDAHGIPGRFQNSLRIYGRDICSKCGEVVEKGVIAGRTTRWCEKCQQ